MNYYTIKEYCASNGPGVRTAIYLSGCPIHCEGCFNKIAWDFGSGRELHRDVVKYVMDTMEPDYIRGLSILGGEPLADRNQIGTHTLCEAVRKRFGKTKDIWIWTGYTIDKIPITPFTDYILSAADVIVDGPFISEKYEPDLKFRGSSNQRILTRNEFLTMI